MTNVFNLLIPSGPRNISDISGFIEQRHLIIGPLPELGVRGVVLDVSSGLDSTGAAQPDVETVGGEVQTQGHLGARGVCLCVHHESRWTIHQSADSI